MKVLVLNSGSSSIKYQLLDMENEKLIAKGIVERIGLKDSTVGYENHLGIKFKLNKEIESHLDGIKIILENLLDHENGVIKNIEEIQGVGHRVTQGAKYFTDSVLVTDDVKEKIQKTCEIAPLHNSPQYKCMLAIEEVLPGNAARGGFRVEDVAQPQQHPEAFIRGIAMCQRTGDLQRMPDRRNDRDIHILFSQRFKPEVRKPANPGVLEHE